MHHQQYPAEQQTINVYDERPPERSAFERVLESVKNVIVIITCMAILITLSYAYLAIQEMVDGVRELVPFTPMGE